MLSIMIVMGERKELYASIIMIIMGEGKKLYALNHDCNGGR